ncbi:MAG: xseA [Bacteroidetes bacterium]|nr:xseA [Bacteroidota bacterium]
MTEAREIFSLFELNQAVREAVKLQLPNRYWIRAELSEVHPNRNGHCYLEFIEKDDSNRQIIAKSRGIIFANTFVLLKSYFEEQTGTAFTAGIKVLVSVSVDFSEVYGISLRVWDIDPNFTLGDMARKRAEIIRRLEEEGVLDLNKELEIPSLCQRIAVISSSTAAGYGDFCNQLENNAYGFVFYTKLFPAIMQGERTEASIIEALEKIYVHADLFDVVVLIRGGGATSDLNSFDSYLLAANCAQFPLPIISGIGHERDETVIDHVAHTRVKTPTAAAAFLIEQQAHTLGELEFLQRGIAHRIQSLQQQRHALIENICQRLTYIANFKTKTMLSNLETIRTSFAVAVSCFSTGKKHDLAMMEQYVQLVSPENILKKGYALVLKNNKIVKSVNGIQVGDDLQVRMADGSVDVKSIKK